MSQDILLERIGTHEAGQDQQDKASSKILEFYDEVREEYLKRVKRFYGEMPEKSDTNIENQLKDIIAEIVRLKIARTPDLPMAEATKKLQDEILGWGPITDYKDDPDIEEIEVNTYDDIWIEKNGIQHKTGASYESEEHLLKHIHNAADEAGRTIDESQPMLDGRLSDGSRFNAVIPPLAVKGPCLTIRKFKKKLNRDELIEKNTFPMFMLDLFKAVIDARYNIMVSGAASSGKTNFLNMFSSMISHGERLIVAEDTQELEIKHPNYVRLETRPASAEGKGEITMRDLVRNSLRMRPDRIIIGEVRSGEALDMLQAMNTGHDGGLTTGHANSPEDMLSRLESMVLMAEPLDIHAIRKQIAAGIHLIVHLSRFEDGSRKVTRITEVTNRIENNTIQAHDIITYNYTRNKDGSISGTWELSCPRDLPIIKRLQEYNCDLTQLDEGGYKK